MQPSDMVWTILLSAAPISELRGGIPFALAKGASPAVAAAVAILANLAIVPVLVFGLGWFERLFRHWRFAARVMDWVFARTRRKGRVIERFGDVALILLVAIPLPGTGAWTGALAAFLFGIPPRRSLPLIAAGVLVAGGLVLLASLGVIAVFGLGG